jgi:branched-chain amino acid transport system ATP-binding protein
MLSIEGLCAGYAGSDALHSVALSVRPGTIVAVVGPNGAGKSTLVNTISRLVAARKGSIRFEGEDITTLDPASAVARGIIQVPEGRQVFASMTVIENLKLGFQRLVRRRGSAKLFKQRLDYVVELFPVLAQRQSQRAGSMSGGEQQMVAMGRALMADPKLLLLDEPSLGLAPMIVDRIFEVLAALRRDGCTMLLVEQHADEALKNADYGYVVSVGRVRAEGPGPTLRGNVALGSVYLGRAAAAVAAR